MRVILLIMTLFTLTNCTTTKHRVTSEEPYPFVKTEKPVRPKIGVVRQDVEIYTEYRALLEAQIDYHNQQIDDYFESIKKQKEEESKNEVE